MTEDFVGTWEKPLAVITGAAGGLGRAVSRRLGARYRLVLADVHAGAVASFKDTLAEEGFDVALSTTVDVGDRDSVERFAREVAATGTLGTLIHTAGVSPSMTDWTSIVHINLVGTAYIMDAFLPQAQPGSSAICIASLAAHTFPSTPEADAILDDPYAPDLTTRLEPLLHAVDIEKSEFSFKVRAYGASKRGVIRLVEERAIPWAKIGARVASISPGTIFTPMGRQEDERNPIAASAAEITPLRRRGMPSDIATAIEFLTSDLASYITGCDLRVDGGIVAARNNAAR